MLSWKDFIFSSANAQQIETFDHVYLLHEKNKKSIK